MNELNPISIGLTPTGYECHYDPRREYRYTKVSQYTLADFFHVNPDTFRSTTEKVIWLTKATMEDLLIYRAFVEGHKAVVIQSSDNLRELFVCDDEAEIKHLVTSTDSTVFVNPKLILPTH